MQILDGEVMTDAVVGGRGQFNRAPRDRRPPRLAKSGKPMLVTGSDGNQVHELDGQPALDVYLERRGCARGAPGPQEFTRFAQTRPLGLDSRRG